ncbi:MAG: tyrosine-type recombinase/integrase [Actinomycetota bacterium]
MAHVQRKCSRCRRSVPAGARACPGCGSREASWVARYRGPDRLERSRTFDRKTDAERWLTSQEASKQTGAWVDPALGRMTFGDWVERWEDQIVDLRPTTRLLNLGITRNYLLPRFGRWPLSGIRTGDVQTMVAEELAAGKLSRSAVRRHAIVLGTILGAAAADGRLARNPVRGVKLPSESSRPMRFLEPEQIARLAEAHPPHYRPLVLTAAYVGLRWGELAGLALDRVDLLRRTIRVERQVLEVGGRLEFGPPKTRAGNRTVSLPGGLGEVLAEHFACPAVQSSGLAFPGPKGATLRRSGFRRVWVKACARAQIDGIVFHELRHTAAALAIAQGAHPLAIKERLGHSSITVTMDTYGGLFPRLEEAIGEGLDEVFREAAAGPLRDQGGTVAQMRRSEG